MVPLEVRPADGGGEKISGLSYVNSPLAVRLEGRAAYVSTRPSLWEAMNIIISFCTCETFILVVHIYKHNE